MAIPIQAFKSTTAFKEIYAANPQTARTTVIFVEGDDDKEILERWFEREIRDELLKFKKPTEQNAKADGCAYVIQVVDECAGAAIPVFGIVDRDATVGPDITLFMEVDDKAFRGSRLFGDRVRILSRWEIESYLFSPQAILKLLRDNKGNQDVSLGSREIIEEAMKVSEAVLLLSAVNLIIRDKQLGEGFVPRWKVRETCSAEDMLWHLARESSIWSQVEPELAAMKDKLKRFTAGFAAGTEEYIHAFLRCLDGKAMLSRLFRLVGLEDSDKVRRALARIIAFEGVPSEIRAYIDDFLSSARSSPV
jgi:hypothetical protein